LKTLEKIDILRRKENIKNSFKIYESEKMNNGNLDLADYNNNNYCINYYTSKFAIKVIITYMNNISFY